MHTTAPSRGQDDARYRALAQAYLDFQPAEIHRLEYEAAGDSGEDVDIQANSQLQEELADSTLEERESEASYRPDDEPEPESVPLSSTSQQNMDLRLELSQGIISPVLSFNSVLDNADSPAWRDITCSQRLPAAVSGGKQKQNSQCCWKEHRTEIADSQPEENRAIPGFSSPTRILELYLQQIQSSGERSSSSYGIGRNEQQPAPSSELPYGIPHPRLQPFQKQAEDPSSTYGVQSSTSPQKNLQRHSPRALKLRSNNPPSTQDPATSSKRKWRESSLDASNISSSSAPTRLAIESSTITTRTTRSRKRQYTDGSVDEITNTKEVTSSRVTMATASSAPSFEAQSVWAKKSEIRPPPPKTSLMDLTPETLVTPSLQQLAQKMPLKALFRPKDQTRDLRPMERGYWLVKCGNWDLGVRNRCWECLGNFIGRSMGGWGVWCIKGEELETVRLYCWGVIVGHAYLLLYMASESKIKETGACWISGDGEAIITMPS